MMSPDDTFYGNAFRRMTGILSEEQLSFLRHANVLIVGIGGVGGIAAEMIARSGVSSLTLVDGDVIEISNLNRQLVALTSTLGRLKTEVMSERIRDINPALSVKLISRYLEPDDIAPLFEHDAYQLVVDAIDSVDTKVRLLAECVERHVPVVSSMGAGLRLAPEKIQVDDISKTSVCPLAKKIRTQLKKNHGITTGIRCVFSVEPPMLPQKDSDGRNIIGTISYMPTLFGVRCAAEGIRLLNAIDVNSR